MSRLYYLSPNDENPLASADKAVDLNPYDPNAHFIRAGVLTDRGELSGAIIELESAIALRPQDFSLWLMLGDWRLQNKDEEGARLAYMNALHLAPHYSEPHRALGNLFRTQGRLDDAFKEFRSAAAVNPALLPEIIDDALKAYPNDGAAVRLAVQPQSPSAHLLLANAFLDNGAVNEAIVSFRSSGVVDEADRRSFMDKLLRAKRFVEAFKLWAGLPAEGEIDRKYLGAVTNHDFEKLINLKDVGFDWRIDGHQKNLRIKLDGKNPYSGVSSLGLDFNGKSDTSSPIIYQLVLVEPNVKYRLSFMARTEELVTGAPPVVSVADADNNRTLAQSSPIPKSTNGWQKFTLDYATAEHTSAVIIAIQRKASDSAAYPIFGQLWVDEVVLEKSFNIGTTRPLS